MIAAVVRLCGALLMLAGAMAMWSGQRAGGALVLFVGAAMVLVLTLRARGKR
jgi:hypothetical protein